MKNKSESGSVIISIDFEMRWGVHDLYGLNIDKYRKNLENSRPAVIHTLKMLEERKLRSTWATVGALGLNDWDEYFNLNPPIPDYKHKTLKILDEYSNIDPKGHLHFAPDLIKKIIKTKGQDLGSHSFSHLYFLEDGIKESDFIEDGLLVKKLFEKKFKITPLSFVFPRNQINFIDCLKNLKLLIFRSIPYLYSYNYLTNKVINLYNILSPSINGPFTCNSKYSTGNFFVRFNLNKILWNLQLLKIKNKLINLKKNEVLHIWWHPHNVGPNFKFGIDRFEQLFDLLFNQIKINKLNSFNMKDLINQNDIKT
tara:strand:- start:8867 stop:9799 length:933 start_codon:yes stop_codon:yes gene_type:complete